MVYKNISNSKKVFYGVTFKPGDIKEVPGYVNDKQMIVSTLPIIPKIDTKPVKVTKSTNPDKSVKVEETESQIIKEEQTNG